MLAVVLNAIAFLLIDSTNAAITGHDTQRLLRGTGTAAEGRTLWTYWDGDSPPALVELCLRSLEHHVGRGWSMQVVSLANAFRYVDRKDVPDAFPKMRPSFQADALRLALLRRHGGAWIDATTIMREDVADWAGVAFDAGSNFVGFTIAHFSAPEGPPLIASWALAVPKAEEPVMQAWHEGYLRLWHGRTTDDDISSDAFFNGADLSHVHEMSRDYLHVELVLLAVLQRNQALREAFLQTAALKQAEDTAYALQEGMGLEWMVQQKCAPITTEFTALPAQTQDALRATPMVKFRHADRMWLMKMSASDLTSHKSSVVGFLLDANIGSQQSVVEVGSGSESVDCSNDQDSQEGTFSSMMKL